MNILTTVFLRYDNEKIYNPNSVLYTKPIRNFYRSADMSDGVEFSIDFTTPIEKIGLLKDKMKKSPDPVTGTRNQSFTDTVRVILGRKHAWICGLLQYVSFYGTAVAYVVTTLTYMRAILKANC